MPRLLTIMLGAIALIVAIVGIRSLMPGGDDIRDVQADKIPTLDKALPDASQGRNGMPVVVIRSQAVERPLFLSVGGRTEARILDVKSQSAGTVTSAPVTEGTLVDKDTLLCGLDVDGASAKVREAEASIAGKRQAYEAAVKLVANGWATEGRLTSAKAALDGAQASLDVARSELRKMQVRAPFRGVFEKRNADVGQFLNPGGSCGVVVQLDPIVFVAQATEKQAGQIIVDGNARVRLSDGAEVEGKVTYLARVADASTRQFRVEVSVPNPANAITVGRTAEIKVETGRGYAHRVSPALLLPDDQGRIGVRFVDVGGVVSFVPADIIDETAEGIWVAGLPRNALLVAEGQDNVKAGLRVTPNVREDGGAPAP
ncbi:MAG TPA: efflux RND transporter periplasmic adaptor subunit [Hyphomonadaceae bacterium]|nr:efflux RND transporter periplasmic adaptor subunit [Hyphomonadaceae bacterium]HPI48413.1 efflux RND transporter periplasmic adaptor subunit [Hyphomonadaceae bacterium]